MNKNLIKEIAASLKAGAVAILPTDTVYGLFCSAISKKGVRSVYNIKGREHNKPLQVFFPDTAMMEKYTAMGPALKKKIKRMLPGPYTVILKLKPALNKSFSFLKTGTIGVRIVRSALINGIMKELKAPVAATSANISGDVTPVKFGNIGAGIISQVCFAINDDKMVKGKASRVIDLTSGGEKILRK